MNATRDDAAEALRLVQIASEDMARRAKAPAWYHPALGALVGGLLAVQAVSVQSLRFAYFPVYALGLILLVQAYRKRTGVWVNGYRRGRTLFVTIGGLALSLLAALAAARFGGETPAAFLVGGAALAVIVSATSVLWEVVYRAEMRAGA